MKRISLLPFVILMFIGLKNNYAQALDWTRVLQLNTFGIHPFNTVSANANNIFAGIAITSNITFDETNFTPIGAKDLLLVKLNHDGTIVWKKQLNANTNGTIYSISIKPDVSGNIYVTGILFGSSTIGSSTISTSGSTNAVFLAKFDSDGNGLWATTLFYSTGSSSIRIETDASGNAYLLCNSSKIIKISSTGSKLWEQTYPVKTLQSIAIYGTNLYIGGCLQGQDPTVFGAITLTPSGAYNTGFILKGDLDGNYTNSVVVGGSPMNDGSSVSDIIFDGSGNLIITGGFVKDLVLGTITITKTSQSYYTYIAKCDNSFNFSWAKSSTDLRNYYRLPIWNYRLFLDNSNSIYQYGFNDYSFNYDAIQHVSPGRGGQFLFKFDSNGSPTNGYALNNTSLEKFTVTSGGKFIFGANYTQDHPNGYGNFYLTQLNNDLTENWTKVSSNCLSGTVSIKYIKHDAARNTYICARILGRCNYFGTDFNTTTSLTIISKHDINGNMLWLNQISDISPNLYGTSFILDEDNNVLIVGLFKTSLTVGTTTLTSSNLGYEGYVAKYNTSGVFQWASKMNLGEDVSYNITLAIDDDSNVIVSGVKSPKNYIVKFNSNGEKLWAKSFPMESYYFSQVTTDANNNIYLTSETYLAMNTGTTTIGTITFNQLREDGATVLIKFDPDGNALWVKTYGGVSGANSPKGFPCDSKTDASGNTYLWGWCENNSVFGSTTLTNPFPTFDRYSYYLAKINTTGDVVWAKAIYENKYSYNYGDLLDLDKNGNIYMGGHFRDKISIEGNEYAPEGTNDFFISKYSNDGNFQWIKTIPSDGESIINSLCVLNNDVLSIVGLAGKNPTLGNTTINSKRGVNAIVATLGNLKYINVSSNSLTIAAAANSTNNVNITSNINWTVSSNQAWITPSSTSGSGNATLTLTASINPTITTRTATITISGSGVSDQTITVTQDAGAAALSVSSSSLTIAAPANSTNTFSITSNINWTTNSDQNWLTTSVASGSGNATITLTATANPNTVTRTAIVTVSGSNVASQTVTVTQDAGTTGIDEIAGLEKVKIYPNPSNGRFTLRLDHYNNQNIEVSICDALGNTLKKFSINGIPEIYTDEVNLENIAKGLYFVIIQTNKSKVVKTITITNP